MTDKIKTPTAKAGAYIKEYKNKVIPFNSQVVLRQGNRTISGKDNKYRILALFVLAGNKGLNNLDIVNMGYSSLDLSDYIYKIRHNLHISVLDEWEYSPDGRRYKRWWIKGIKILSITEAKQ